MSESALVFAKELDTKGSAINHTEINTALLSDKPLWFHFDANNPGAMDIIHDTFPDIDEYTLSAISNPDARPRTLQLDNGVLIILRGINHNEGDEPEDMIAVRMWVTETRIISLRYRKSKALMQVSKSFDHDRGPKSIGDIVTLISSTLFGYIESGIDALDDKIGLLESRVLDRPDKKLRSDISDIRKSAIILRRFIAPQRDVINQLRYSEVTWLSAKNLRRIQETQDVLLRGIEELDAIRERSQVVKDELVNSLSDRLNRNLYVISVITAIFLPLGFLTGLFGVNIGGMPGIDNTASFVIFSSILGLIVFIQISIFKLFKWF